MSAHRVATKQDESMYSVQQAHPQYKSFPKGQDDIPINISQCQEYLFLLSVFHQCQEEAFQ